MAKHYLIYFGYLITSVAALLLFLEGTLVVGHTITGHHRLGTLKEFTPKDLPDDVVKIALFGGSSAAGAFSVVGMGTALEFQLKHKAPNHKFYIKNFARNGAAFHGHQADILKSVIDDYDIFLIYSGHNEAANYLRQTCYGSDPALMCEPSDPYTPGNSGLIEWLRSNSRIIAITRKINAKYIEPHVQLGDPVEISLYRPPKFDMFETNKVIPSVARQAIDDNFSADLQEIAYLSKQKGKHILISNLPSSSEYSPSFSVHRDGLQPKQQEKFHNSYHLGLNSYRNSNYPAALEHFLVAYDIDDEPAVLNYKIGKSLLHLGNTFESQEFFRQSINNDGFLLRSPDSLHQISQEVAAEYSNVRFLDSVKTFQEALGNGIHQDELFMDFQHPNAIGHILITRNFLNALSELDILKESTMLRTNFDPEEIREELANYNVPLWNERRTKFHSSAWHIGQASSAADPTTILAAAERHINEFYGFSDKTEPNRALLFLMKALIAAEAGASNKAIELGNEASKISPETVNDFLYNRIFLDGNDLTGDWIPVFQYRNIDYSPKTAEFFTP